MAAAIHVQDILLILGSRISTVRMLTENVVDVDG